MVWATVGSSTLMGWKRRSSAASFSRCLRYSSRVVAPMVCSSPRASMGLRIEAASMAPSAAPAPTSVCSSSMNRMMSPRVLDLLEHLLEALLEVAAVAGAGHQGAEVERVELLVGERLGHRVVGDGLGQALDDGRLADAGLADEHRVVLGAAREHLHDALGLAGAADDRVELLVAGQLGEVATELVEHERAGLGAGLAALAGPAGLLLATGAGVAREQLDDLLAHTVEVGAELDQHLGGDALALTDEAEEDVLGADVVVAELERLAERQLEHLLGAGGEGDVPAGRRAALADDLLDLAAHRLERDAEGLERLGGDTLTLVDQPEQDVLGADVVVVEQPRFFLRQHDDSTGLDR